MRHKLVAAAVFGLALLGSSSAAHAGDVGVQTPLGNGICDPGEFCLYRDSNRTGPVRDYNQGVDDVTYTNNSFPIVGGRVNDEVSSVWNRTTCTVRVFVHSDFNGNGTQVPPGASPNLSGTPVGNDEASSHNACV